jgi:diguanylate cyclase (GGDEF)-like protein
MTTQQNRKISDHVSTHRPIVKALNQSEHVKDVVEECAEELSNVNSILQRDASAPLPIVHIEKALTQSVQVENKVSECAEELSSVNGTLAEEIEERIRLEHDLHLIKEQEEKARHLALHDPLTGLPNRMLFKDRLDHGLEQAARHGWCIAVIFIDLDDFKSINDTYGHDVGDMVLKTISQRLQEKNRAEDTVSRQGGDEFLYLLLEIKDVVHIDHIVNKIMQSITEPCQINALNLVIQPSIGIATFPKDGATAEGLIKCADDAMYRAKRNHSGFAYFSEDKIECSE